MQSHLLANDDEHFIEECARSVIAVHGENAERFVAEQIATVAGRLDMRAIETWQQIRRKVVSH